MRRWRSVGYKVFILYFVSMSISITFMGYFFYRKASDIIQSKVSEVALQTIQQANRRLETIFEEYENRSQLIIGYRDLQKGILNKFPDSYQQYQNTMQITNFLSNMVNSKNDMVRAYILGEQMASYRYSVNETPTIAELPPVNNASRSQDWYKKIKEADGRIVWFGIRPSFMKQDGVEEDKRPVFCLGRALKNLDHMDEVIGVTILEIDPGKLQDILSELDFHAFGTAIIVDKDDQVVADASGIHTMQSSGLKLPEADSGIAKNVVQGEEMITVFDRLSVGGWKLAGMAPAKNLVQDTSEIGIYTLYLAIGFMAVSIFLAFIAAREMQQPVRVLLQSMRQVREGDFDLQISNHRKDEFGLLFEGFNVMVTRIKTLIDELYVQRLLKTETQLKMLGSQINAHFLYNTLDSIHWISRIHKVDKISEMIFGLSKYLRISLSEGKDLVSVREIAELLENYLLIQKMRYEDKFEVNIELEPGLLDRKVLKFVFQPLVENAIYHGLENKKEKGRLDIRWLKLDEILCFEVIDDGVGIHPDKLAELKEMLNNQDTPGEDNFALKNINMQIKLAYGPQYGLYIESEPGEGTKVAMVFPLR